MKKEQLKVAVIGGGSSYTPELIEGFIRRQAQLPVQEIVLVDIEGGQEKLETVGRLAQRMTRKADAPIRVSTTLERATAIQGADFVVTQLRVGGLDARIRDERIPLAHGLIGQETTGAGGFANALRTIPVMLEIGREIERLAPEAWLINFTNPAGIVTEAVLKHTRVKALGVCNVPLGMLHNATRLLQVEPTRLAIDFIGLNHLVWGRSVRVDGKEALPQLIELLAQGGALTMKNIKDLAFPPAFLRALQLFPCPYHRYYYMRGEMLQEEQEAAASGGTRGEQVRRTERELFALYRDEALAHKPQQLEQRGGAHYSDAACALIDSIYNDKQDIQVVNVQNQGALPELPADAVIERNCIIGAQGAKPLRAGRLPTAVRGLVQAVKAYEELTVLAAVSGNPNTALLALAAHPLVPTAALAQAVWNDILTANEAEFTQFGNKSSGCVEKR